MPWPHGRWRREVRPHPGGPGEPEGEREGPGGPLSVPVGPRLWPQRGGTPTARPQGPYIQGTRDRPGTGLNKDTRAFSELEKTRSLRPRWGCAEPGGE